MSIQRHWREADKSDMFGTRSAAMMPFIGAECL